MFGLQSDNIEKGLHRGHCPRGLKDILLILVALEIFSDEKITSGKLLGVSCPHTGTFVWFSLSHTQLSLIINTSRILRAEGIGSRDTSGVPLTVGLSISSYIHIGFTSVNSQPKRQK